MAEFRMDVVVADLDELTTVLNNEVLKGGPSDKVALWVLKGWDKLSTMILGGNYHRRSVGVWIMKRDPPAGTLNFAKVMLRAIEDYSSALERNGTRGGDIYNRADQAVMNFAWAYRKNLTGKKEAEWLHGLQAWLNFSEEQVLNEVLFRMDQSA